MQPVPGVPDSAALTCTPDTSCAIRLAKASDFAVFKQAHRLLPVLYQDAFFRSVLRGKLPFLALCSDQPGDVGQLAAFATARVVKLQDASHNDQQCIARLLGGAVPRRTPLVYILTIGVLPQRRREGLATELLRHIIEVRRVSAPCTVLHDHQLQSTFDSDSWRALAVIGVYMNGSLLPSLLM